MYPPLIYCNFSWFFSWFLRLRLTLLFWEITFLWNPIWTLRPRLLASNAFLHTTVNLSKDITNLIFERFSLNLFLLVYGTVWQPVQNWLQKSVLISFIRFHMQAPPGACFWNYFIRTPTTSGCRVFLSLQLYVVLKNFLWLMTVWSQFMCEWSFSGKIDQNKFWKKTGIYPGWPP